MIAANTDSKLMEIDVFVRSAKIRNSGARILSSEQRLIQLH
jgi:cold shock CspA family protein